MITISNTLNHPMKIPFAENRGIDFSKTELIIARKSTTSWFEKIFHNSLADYFWRVLTSPTN